MQFVLKRKVIARRASAVPWNAGQAKVNSLCEIPREFTLCDCNIIIALRTEKKSGWPPEEQNEQEPFKRVRKLQAPISEEKTSEVFECGRPVCIYSWSNVLSHRLLCRCPPFMGKYHSFFSFPLRCCVREDFICFYQFLIHHCTPNAAVLLQQWWAQWTVHSFYSLGPGKTCCFFFLSLCRGPPACGLAGSRLL